MRMIFAMALAALSFAPGAPLLAQRAPGPFMIGIGGDVGGMGKPQGIGIAAQASFRVPLRSVPVSPRLVLMGSQRRRADPVIERGARIISASIEGVVESHNGVMRPFLTAGGGLAAVRMTTAYVTPPAGTPDIVATKTTPVVSGGLGGVYFAEKLWITAEARIIYMPSGFNDVRLSVPLTIGVRF